VGESGRRVFGAAVPAALGRGWVCGAVLGHVGLCGGCGGGVSAVLAEFGQGEWVEDGSVKGVGCG